MTLLSKTPEWGILGSRLGLLDTHGYEDVDGRWALYASLYAGRENPGGWALVNDRVSGRVFAARHGLSQVWWTYETLERRILEKHHETVFVTAYTVVDAGVETYLFDHVLHCRDASLANFLTLIDERGIFLDFAMHRLPNGAARDHGFLFRTTRARLPTLFRTVNQSAYSEPVLPEAAWPAYAHTTLSGQTEQ